MGCKYKNKNGLYRRAGLKIKMPFLAEGHFV
jgi:hypothetical protein